MKFTPGLAAILFGTTAIALVQPHLAVVAQSQSAAQVAATARQITVLIEGQNPGSGVIIRREGNTYTVLTARHVVATPDEYNIVTPDGQKYRLNYNTVKPLPGVDLATVEFTSAQTYSVAKLGNSRNAPSGTTVYVAGFPAPTAAINQSVFSFLDGKMIANAERPLADGYALVYSNNTLPGMSGGPVLNGAGEVIGIHGKGDAESSKTQATANPNVTVKTGYNLAIPINTFLSLAGRTGVVGFTAPAAAPVSNLPTTDDLYLQAANKLRNFDNKGAITDFDQVIRLNPQNAGAYRDRALARLNLADNTGACADLDRSLQLNAQDGLAYSRRASCRFNLGNQKGAMQDIDRALQLSPNDARVYVNRGSIRNRQKDFNGAIADYDQAIRLDPNFAQAYNNRGVTRRNLQDYRGAIGDYDQAIRLNPNFADAYNNRGIARGNLQDYRGAIADFDQAIRLNPNFAGAYIGRGFVRNSLQDYRGAITDLDQAIRLNPNFAPAYYDRGVNRWNLQDYRGAIADYDQAIRLNPNLAHAYNGRGISRLDLGDRQGAIADYQRAADLARSQGNQQLYELAMKNLKSLQR